MKLHKLLAVLIALSLVATFFIGAAAEGVINYAAMWTEGEPAAQWIAHQARAFTEKTGVEVNITFVGRDVLTKIKSQILTGDAPDIVDQDLSEITAALLAGGEEQIMPLDDILNGPAPDGEEKLMDVFNKGFLDLYAFNGQNYFIPYMFITSGFYYDKALWADEGISVPGTWDEFIAAGEAFQSAGIDFLAQDYESMYNAYYYYWACARILGPGKLLEAAKDETGAKWDDPGFLKAADLIYELSAGGKHMFQKDYAASQWPAGQSDFALGSQAALMCGTWIPVEVGELAGPEFEWGFFPFPVVEGGAGNINQMEAYLIGWSVPAGAKNADAAKDFLVFMSSHESAQGFVDGSYMGARLDCTMPEVLADVAPHLAAAESFFLSYDGCASQAGEWFNNVFYPLDDKLLHGSITPEEFIAAIKADTIAFYSK